MAGKRETPEDIVSKLRRVDVLPGQGMTVANAVCQIGVTLQTCSVAGASSMVAWTVIRPGG